MITWISVLWSNLTRLITLHSCNRNVLWRWQDYRPKHVGEKKYHNGNKHQRNYVHPVRSSQTLHKLTHERRNILKCVPTSTRTRHMSLSSAGYIQPMFFQKFHLTSVLVSMFISAQTTSVNPCTYSLCSNLQTRSTNWVWLTLRLLMSYIYGAPILDVSRSHTTTYHSR